MDGMSAIHAIKELKPEIPVIIASGSKRDTDQMRRGDPEHLTRLGKPFSVEQTLGKAIEKAVLAIRAALEAYNFMIRHI